MGIEKNKTRYYILKVGFWEESRGDISLGYAPQESYATMVTMDVLFGTGLSTVMGRCLPYKQFSMIFLRIQFIFNSRLAYGN